MLEISHIVLIVLVGLIIIYLFENIIHKTKPSNSIQTHDSFSDTYRPIKSDHTIPESGLNPLKENDLQTDYYIDKFLLNHTRCPRPTQSIKDFNQDFFKFRDYTENNSSMRFDPVDKITNLYLSDDLGPAQGRKNMKIKDMFDYLTSGTNLYHRDCVRLPYFDNTMHNGYNSSFATGMHNTRDNWLYENENPLNGGMVDNNLYPHDPEALEYLPAL